MTTTLFPANTPRRATLALVATLALTLAGLEGCRKDMAAAAVQQAPIVDGNDTTDPANANMAVPLTNGSQAVYTSTATPTLRYAAPATRVAGSSYSEPQQQSAENYPPANGARNEAYNYNTQPPQGYSRPNNQAYNNEPQNYTGDDDQLYSDLLDTNTPIAQQPPPPLPVYEQPVAPGPDYLWTPGYWNYAPAGYYYVPGTWVSAPFAGALWTPGWWGYTGRGYGWHRGYWGRHVGYYGGVNYGFGFIGIGYQGGYWNNDHFQYNRDCNHVDPRVVNNYVYQRNVTVINNTYINNSRTSYYGGPDGLQRPPMQAEFAAQREVHIAPLPAQVAERQQASQNRQQFFAANSGRPAQLFAAHPVIEHNVAVPPQLARPQSFNNGSISRDQAGFNSNQLRQQQQIAIQQQAVQREQVNLQRQQQDQGRQLQVQQRAAQQDQARQLQEQQRVAQQQQTVAHNAQQQQQLQRQQQQLQQQQERAVQAQQQLGQRNALQQQRQQLEQQHLAQQTAAQQQHNLQAQQQLQQRAAVQQQRQQVDQQRLAQQTAAQQQRNLQAQQQLQQRAAEQRQQIQQPQLRQQSEQRAAPQQPRPQPAPQQHVEAPHSAPQQHAEAPRNPRR